MTAHGCRRTTDPGPQEKEGCPVPLGGGGGQPYIDIWIHRHIDTHTHIYI